MKPWAFFPSQLDKPSEAKHDTAGWTVVSRVGTHPSNGAPCQIVDVPDGTPDGHGCTLLVNGTTKYHGVLYLDLPTGVGLVNDVFPFKSASTPASARRGMVRLAGKLLYDDDGPFNPLDTTLFWALGRAHNGERERVKANLHYVRTFNYDAARILCQVAPYNAASLWNECPIDPTWPSYEAELTALLDLAYDECGLRLKLTVLGGGDPDPVGTARKVARIVAGREHKVLLIEPVNEHNADVEDVKRMILILQATGCLVVPGFGDVATGWGIEDMKALAAETGADGCSYHTSRVNGDNGARQVRQCWDLKEFPDLTDDGEGPGPGSSVADFPNLFKNASKAAAMKICGASKRCHHTGDGVYGKTYQATTGMRYANLWERPGADEIFAAVRHADDHIPHEVVNWRPFNTNHPLEVQTGSVNKLYGADAGDGRCVEIAIGCETAVLFKATQPIKASFWNPATGESCGAFDLTAGQTCQPSGALWCYVIEIQP